MAPAPDVSVPASTPAPTSLPRQQRRDGREQLPGRRVNLLRMLRPGLGFVPDRLEHLRTFPRSAGMPGTRRRAPPARATPASSRAGRGRQSSSSDPRGDRTPPRSALALRQYSRRRASSGLSYSSRSNDDESSASSTTSGLGPHETVATQLAYPRGTRSEQRAGPLGNTRFDLSLKGGGELTRDGAVQRERDLLERECRIAWFRLCGALRRVGRGGRWRRRDGR